MGERTRNILVGITSLAGVFGLVVLMMLFGYRIEGGYRVTIEMSDAAGLNKDNRVHINGVDIGWVELVQLRSPHGSGVLVRTRIREVIDLPEDMMVEVTSDFIGGSSTINFVTAAHRDPGEPALLPKDGLARVSGRATTPVGRMATELRVALRDPIDQINRIAQTMDEFSQEWMRVGRNLNLLVEPRGVEAVDAGDAIGNLSSIVARADSRLAQMKQALEGINRYVNDEQLYEDVRVTATQSRELTAKLSDRVDRLIATLTEGVESLSQRYVALADDIAGAVGSMRKFVDQARAGDGTVGKLLNDAALYDNLNDAAQRLQQAVDELRLLLQKWKAEGLPVQF